MAKRLYSIGYAGFPDINDFLHALKENEIQILIDVRSTPYSAFHSIYNKDNLCRLLKDNGIYYVNYARQFGARQDNKAFYKNGRLDFETFSKSDQFLEGINNVEKSNAVIAFMCAEKKPSTCHRAILVTRAFSDRGYEITHIMSAGESITQRDIEQELLKEYFPNRGQESLFEESNINEEGYIAKAYKLRNDEIGFRLEDLRP